MENDTPFLPLATFRNAIEVNSIDDFNLIADEMLSDFAISLLNDKKFLNDEYNEEYDAYYFNDRAMELITRYAQRLRKIAEKIFTEDQLQWLDVRASNLEED